VALATSAAPTYFPPHVAEGRTFVDGGLVANAPDLVLLTEFSSASRTLMHENGGVSPTICFQRMEDFWFIVAD
jgi:patatin-like phospholipase/acyl hydrolase